MKRKQALIAFCCLLVLWMPGLAEAKANPAFSNGFEIKYRVDGASRFTVTSDGKVTVRSRATVNSVNKKYWIEIQREVCGFWGCLSWETVGAKKEYLANGADKTHSWSPGNSSRKHRLTITKTNDGILMKGTVWVS